MSCVNCESKIEKWFKTNIEPWIDLEDEDVNMRYSYLLDHYIELMEKNDCKCFGSDEDLIKELEKTKDQNIKWLKSHNNT
jgi:hypothetical protein